MARSHFSLTLEDQAPCGLESRGPSRLASLRYGPVWRGGFRRDLQFVQARGRAGQAVAGHRECYRGLSAAAFDDSGMADRQSRTVVSELPEAKVVPSGEKARDNTEAS